MSLIDSVKNLIKGDKTKKIDIPSKYGSYEPFMNKEAPKISKKEESKLAKLPHMERNRILRERAKKQARQERDLRAKKVPSPLTAKECPVCQKPMMVSVGSLQFSHGGACRKRARMSRSRQYQKA